MFEERPMPPEPEDDLERMFAAEEAEISDEGFTQRVMREAKPASPWRRATIYGAGFAGFGFAAGGIVEVTSKLPSDWLPDLTGAVQAASIEQAVENASDATQIAIVAIIAGISFLIAAIAVQSR
jgi:hypothetical protein